MATGLDILRNSFVLSIVDSGLDILRKNGWNFEKSINDVYFSLEIIESDKLYDGKIDPTETNEEEEVIRITEKYASDKKYIWFCDELGWAAHEFFHAYCYSRKNWTKNQMEFYKFFKTNSAQQQYPANFDEIIPFVGQFAVMMIKGNGNNIEKVIQAKNNNETLSSYIKIAKGANLNN